MTFGAEVVGEGQMILDDMEAFTNYLKSRKGRIQIRIGGETKPRSLDANAYYWAEVVRRTAIETGHTSEEIHDAWKLKFNPRRISWPSTIMERAAKAAGKVAGSQPKAVKLAIWKAIRSTLESLGMSEHHMVIGGSTATMDPYDFSLYLEKCMADGAEMGIRYQSPDEWRESQM